MKILFLAQLVCIIALAGCNPKKPETETSQASDVAFAMATNLAPGQAVLRFAVIGMTCEHCAGGLRSNLLAATGVKAADVSLKTARAVVVFETNRTDGTQLGKVIHRAGFEGKALSP